MAFGHGKLTLGAVKVAVVFSLVVVACLVSGCSTTGDLGPASSADQKRLIAAATEAPRLLPSEKIRVTVFGEASLSGDYQIDPSGFVSLPLAGTIKAAGLTPAELEAQLAKQLGNGQYLKNPKVTVSIAEFRPFYILGEVEKPGAYPYVGGINVLSAIAIAGGTTYRANHSTVLIQHPGEDGLHEYSMSSPIPVLPGDIIQVPARYF
ncbi:MAG TPA: polysaccharide biosynthesis/export family protein [Stellaceae bacterium]